MKYLKLSNIIRIEKGKKNQVADFPTNESVRLIQIDDLRSDNNIKFTDEKNGVSVNENDLLIVWDGANAGIVGYGKKGYIGSTIAALKIYNKDYNTEFLGKFLQSKFNYLQTNSTGATIPHVNRKSLEELKIPIIHFEDQIRIANLLSRIEGLIAKRKESIRLLDEFVKSTFLEMFGDPVRNEKGWEVSPLEKLGKLDRGVSKHRPRNAPELLGGLYPLIQTGDVSNSGIYITKYNQTYSEIGLKQSKLWPKGTLCITIAANIARTSILTFDACFPDSVVGFTPFSNSTNSIYIYYLFKFFQGILEKNAPQAAQKNINLEILRNLLVPKPEISEQNKFASIVDKVEFYKTKYQFSLLELEKLYGAVSYLAFWGEIQKPNLYNIIFI